MGQADRSVQLSGLIDKDKAQRGGMTWLRKRTQPG